MHRPTSLHRHSVKRLLHYLKQTIHFGLQLKRSKSHSLQVFSDVDWAGCRDDSRSTGGLCVFLGDNLISWGCKKQKTVARSSTEVEYKAFANQLQNLNGCVLFFMSLALLCPVLQFCGVTTLAQLIYLLILFFMPVPSMLKQNSTLSETWLLMVLLWFVSYPAKIN